MIKRDIEIVLEHFKYATINVFVNNTTEIKRDEELVQWFKDEYEFLLENKELLMTVFIVSGLEIEKNERKNEEKIGVKVEVADGKKCERCWMYSTTVGEDKENPNICHRCSEALK